MHSSPALNSWKQLPTSGQHRTPVTPRRSAKRVKPRRFGRREALSGPHGSGRARVRKWPKLENISADDEIWSKVHEETRICHKIRLGNASTSFPGAFGPKNSWGGCFHEDLGLLPTGGSASDLTHGMVRAGMWGSASPNPGDTEALPHPSGLGLTSGSSGISLCILKPGLVQPLWRYQSSSTSLTLSLTSGSSWILLCVLKPRLVRPLWRHQSSSMFFRLGLNIWILLDFPLNQD